MKARIAILISGGGSNMRALLDAMVGDYPARPVLVLSDQPSAPGLEKARKKKVKCAVIARANYQSRAAFEAAMSMQIEMASTDIICLAGFMRVLSADFVQKFKGRILNIHPSLLPKYTGLNTHARVLDAGESEAGCSVHIVTPGLDDGPVLGQSYVHVHAEDTPAGLAAKVLKKEHSLYAETLRDFIFQKHSLGEF